MKNRKRVIAAFLTVAILLLGVGYAALTDELQLTGTAKVDFDDSSEAFDEDIYFSKAISGDGCTAIIDATDNDKGVITVTDGYLKAVGDEVIATYTIKSDSDLSVAIPRPTIINTDTEYFQVIDSWSDTKVVAPNGTVDVTITVKLIKTADTDRAASFTITFNPQNTASTTVAP